MMVRNGTQIREIANVTKARGGQSALRRIGAKRPLNRFSPLRVFCFTTALLAHFLAPFLSSIAFPRARVRFFPITLFLSAAGSAVEGQQLPIRESFALL